eukprot:CAMPEP_0183714738 /NCGR_PEP_ID=MMETSP0737-20130205/9196_1 /TAXON_ID=385413 /ORGANISM="Thalassiosira miniscula, Strain CCMP1093" /LENGTH=471 /DNA_ID=CAMNT_0025943735 /DNA_START=68 /DNA_END=1483 /DNA_ORIENTATION=+
MNGRHHHSKNAATPPKNSVRGASSISLSPSTPTVAARTNIKSKTHSQTKEQWKEKLRKGCLERAKLARRERLRKSRSLIPSSGGSDYDSGPGGGGIVDAPEPLQWEGGANNGINDTNDSINGYSSSSNNGRKLKRTLEQNTNDYDDIITDAVGGLVDTIVDRTPSEQNNNTTFQTFSTTSTRTFREESGNSEENVVSTARSLVEQEYQRALKGIRHCKQVCPLSEGEGVPWKKRGMQRYGCEGLQPYHGGGEEEEPLGENVEFMDTMEGMAERGEESKLNGMEEEYKMSHDEFVNLLNDVAEELQREDELLEEEIWEMERAEAMERERLMDQIDDYEYWEELQQQHHEEQVQQHSQNSQQQQQQQYSQQPSHASNQSSTPCCVPCPICTTSSLIETSPHNGISCANCDFHIENMAHEGLTLEHLQHQLCAVYEEHSRVCTRGVLQFRQEKRAGMSMLMASCDVCHADVVVL